MWWRIIWWVVSFAISDYFRQRLPAQTPSGIGDFNIPTATEGRSVPIIPGGTPRIRAPNCIYYSDFAAIERTVTTGVIFREEETIGFTYELALVYALFKGQAQGLTGIWIGEDKVFDHVTDAGGIPQTVVDIDRDDLFGGVDDGGGFVGRVRLFNGDENQAASAFLESRNPDTPAYRGTCYVVITDQTETKGANIGESNNLRHITYEVQAFSNVASGGLGDVMGLGNDTHFIGPDANPISVAYDLWTNQRWGRRRPVSEINTANFAANAQTVYDEGIGFTLLIDEQTTTDEIQDIIEQHIDGYIGPNPLTGKIEVKLARPDYDIGTVFQVNASNIRGVPKWNKGDWSQTFNRVRIRYTDRAKDWNETHAVEVAPGNRIIQGATLTREVRYQGCHTAEVASKLAAREKKNLAQPASSGQIEVDRTAWQQRPGDVMSFTSAKVFETNLPVRITRAQVGNVVENTMVFDVTADIFGPEISTSVIPPVTDFVPPVQTVEPLLAADQAAFEAPFVLMRYDAQPNTIPRVVTLARRASGSPTEYEVIRRVRAVAGGGAYGAFESSGFVRAGFTQCGELRNALTGWQAGNGGLTIQVDPIGAASLDNLIGPYSPGQGNAGGLCILEPGTANEEWIATREIVDDLGGIRLEQCYRSAMDTPMLPHAAGTRVWFVWTGGMGMPLETYAAGNGVEVKLLPRSPTDAITEPEATAVPEVAILNTIRNGRPLLPRSVAFNGAEFPSTPVSVDFVAQSTPTIILGVLVTLSPRMWNNQDVIGQVQGLDLGQGGLALEDWSPLNNVASWWLYNLDVTPSPVRGADEILSGSFPWDEPFESFILPREDLINAGITGTFLARIEIEIEHSPNGQLPNQITRLPLFYDFDIDGTFSSALFLYSDVAFHSHFDGADAATSAVDESDQAHTITFAGNAQLDDQFPTFGPTSLLLDGTGDYVQFPNHATNQLGAADWSLEFRVRFTGDPGTSNVTFVSQWNTAAQRGWAMALTNNQLRFNWSTDGVNSFFVDRAWDPAGDTDYAIGVFRVGNVLRFFVDGAQIGADIAFTDTIFASGQPVTIGAINAGGFTQFLNGRIDELRLVKGAGIHAAAYTPDTDEFDFHRVIALAGFNGLDGATTYVEESRYATALTMANAAQLDNGQTVFGSASLLVANSIDYAQYPTDARNALGTGDFTIRFRCRITDLATPVAVVLDWRTTLTQDVPTVYITSGGVIVFYNQGTDRITSAASTISAGTWHAIAVSRVAGTTRMYVDGSQVGSDYVDAVNYIANPITIGQAGDAIGGTAGFRGNIDELQIIKKGLFSGASYTVETQELERY